MLILDIIISPLISLIIFILLNNNNNIKKI